MLIKTQDTGGGYLMLDHRASPELPPGVRSPLAEFDTYTCRHCCRVVVMNPDRTRERYKCRGCNHMLCDGCGAIRAAGAACRTFTQLIDEFQQQVDRGGAEHPGLLRP
jgi:hypothetical protein